MKKLALFALYLTSMPVFAMGKSAPAPIPSLHQFNGTYTLEQCESDIGSGWTQVILAADDADTKITISYYAISLGHLDLGNKFTIKNFNQGQASGISDNGWKYTTVNEASANEFDSTTNLYHDGFFRSLVQTEVDRYQLNGEELIMTTSRTQPGQFTEKSLCRYKKQTPSGD